MKVLVFLMKNCPWCDKLKEELKSVPQAKDFVFIDKTNMSSSHKKFGISKYPTIVFTTDTDKMINKLEGFHDAQQIQDKLRGCKRLDNLFERTGKL
jgi:thioredoxin-related protein